MKTIKVLAVMALILLSVSGFSQGNVYGNDRSSGIHPNYVAPVWAPPFYEGARYFYIPDLECYYDLLTREFIFLYDGQWFYSPNIPPIYGDFDLNNSFVVVINIHIYEPWLHHQYFLSHYPRFYYRDYYDHSNIPYVRGFDENYKHAIYWKEHERNRARSWDNKNQGNNHQFRYSKEDRQQQRTANNQGMGGTYRDHGNADNNSQNNHANHTNQPGNKGYNPGNGQGMNQNKKTDQTPGDARQQGSGSQANKSHETNYYGKTIGTPVKVEKQMRGQGTPESSGGSSNNSGSGNVRSNPGRR